MPKLEIELNVKVHTAQMLKFDHDGDGLEKPLTKEQIVSQLDEIDFTQFKLDVIGYDTSDEYSGIAFSYPLKVKPGSVEIAINDKQDGFDIGLSTKLALSVRAGVSNQITNEIGENFKLFIQSVSYKGGSWNDGFRSVVIGLGPENSAFQNGQLVPETTTIKYQIK